MDTYDEYMQDYAQIFHDIFNAKFTSDVERELYEQPTANQIPIIGLEIDSSGTYAYQPTI